MRGNVRDIDFAPAELCTIGVSIAIGRFYYVEATLGRCLPVSVDHAIQVASTIMAFGVDVLNAGQQRRPVKGESPSSNGLLYGEMNEKEWEGEQKTSDAYHRTDELQYFHQPGVRAMGAVAVGAVSPVSGGRGFQNHGWALPAWHAMRVMVAG
jgi:hypothetical protein